MARDIDDVIEFVMNFDRLSVIHKQVVINRLQNPPTEDELKTARAQLGLDLPLDET